MLVVVLVLLYIIVAVASVYPAQQAHLRMLTKAHGMATFSRAKKGETVSSPLEGLLAHMSNAIEDDLDAPHVFGIPAKPTFFYLVIGYMGTAVVAFGVRAVSGSVE